MADIEDLAAAPRPRGFSLVEKIVARHAAEPSPRSGEYVSLRPAHVMTHDNSWHVMKKFKALGATKVDRSSQPVFCLDHDIQNLTEANQQRYADIHAFAEDQGIDFFPPGRGIGHQVLCEEAYVLPNGLVVASDSHSNMYGGLGCLGTPVVRTDACSIWATGQTWWRVPPVCLVELVGELPREAHGKDVILALCGLLRQDEVLNCAVEFGGEGVASLDIDARLTVANMSTEWGCLCGLFPADDKTLAWLEASLARLQADTGASPGPVAPTGDASTGESAPGEMFPWGPPVPSRHAQQSRNDRVERLQQAIQALKDPSTRLAADADAGYSRRVKLDLSSLRPLLLGPNSVRELGAFGAGDEVAVQKCWLISCVNARLTDLEVAANVLAGRKVARTVELYVAPASSTVLEAAQRSGAWQQLLDAGAIPLPSGCGPCTGLGKGTIKDGEVGVSSTNRNFRGRMGGRNAEVYLASPQVVAQAALDGFVRVQKGQHGTAELLPGLPAPPAEPQPLVAGFPAAIRGPVALCLADSISTDGIYAGKHMYEDLSVEQMCAVAMENYDPSFRQKLPASSVLVCGPNFGTGSSREQAAQCFKHLGVQCIVAPSFSATYVRNALNNGLCVLECPALVARLQKEHGEASAAGGDSSVVVPGQELQVDLAAWACEYQGERFPVVPLGPAAQELIAAGGLEPWIKRKVGGA